ncbi:hypothetical protein AX17_007429 [Amanita inopinata Kibby_2008]|nr:hypothetical protein AX17_007429 [Amanita inopinata Kibby_2008]
MSQCLNQCGAILNKVQSPDCKQACICTQDTINQIKQCVDCANSVSASTGQSIPGLGPDYIPNLERDCAQAGYPVNGSGLNSGSNGGSGSGLGNSGGTGTMGNTGGSFTSPGSGSSQSTNTPNFGGNSGNSNGNNGGLGGMTTGHSGAMGMTAQMGAVAAAVAGVVVLAA